MRRWRTVLLTFGSVLVIGLLGLQLWTRFGSTRPPYRYFRIFTEVLYLIDRQYVEPPDYTVIRWGALVGMAKSVGANASILSSDLTDRWQHPDPDDGEIGIRFLDRGNYLLILSVFPNSPAARAGIQRGDGIYAIDDVAVIRMTALEAYLRLRGAPNTRVRLAMWHHDTQKPEYVEVERAVLPPAILDHRYDATRRVGYIHFYEIGPATHEVVASLVQTWTARGLDALVLDVRQCTSLAYDTAWRIADLFLDAGSGGTFIHNVRNQTLATYTFDDTRIYRGPLGIIQDRSTGWACELLATVLNDHHRAITVGRRTLGVITWYTLRPVHSDLMLWLPAGTYQRPDGTPLNARGIPPAVVYEGEGTQPHSDFISGDAIIDFTLQHLTASNPQNGA